MIDEQKQSEKTSEQPEEALETPEQVEQENSPDNGGDVTEEITLDSYDPEQTDLESLQVEDSSGASGPKPEESPQIAIQALQEEVSHLTAKLSKESEQAETYKGQYMRLAADFENYRKRVQKEKEELELKVTKDTITQLLSVVDNFERARTQIKPANDGEMAIHKSYQGVYKDLVDKLKQIGVSAMRPEGNEFDPNLHEAVFREPTDEYPEGTVIEQLVRGYMLGEKVIRHAMVKVAAPKDPVVTSEEETSEEEGTSDT